MLGGFFQRLQQRIERIGRQHMNFIDDIDLIARAGGAILHAFDDFSYIINAGPAGRIHFQHIHMAAFHNRHTMLACSAGLGGGPAAAIGANAIHTLGNDPRGGCFARTTNSCHHESLRDPICLKGVAQRAHHRLLANKIGKGFWPVFAGQNLIALGRGFAHAGSRLYSYPIR